MRKISIILAIVLTIFTNCKPKPKSLIGNVLPNEEILQSEKIEVSKSDTLAFINEIHEFPYDFSSYAAVSRDLLKDDDLNYIPPRELRLIRNEIFARYGYRFKDTVLLSHFAKQDWYKPLFDNVDQYLTPLQRANVNFIMEKEKTNPEISDEDQFRIFLEKYREYRGWGGPRMLLHKFYTTAFIHQVDGHTYSEQLPLTKNYVYLIYTIFGGCNECTCLHSIYQFNKKGELLNKFYLGESDCAVFVDKKSENNYEIWFTFYPGPRYAGDEEIDEEMQKEIDANPVDTIRFRFHYDAEGQIIIAEKKN